MTELLHPVIGDRPGAPLRDLVCLGCHTQDQLVWRDEREDQYAVSFAYSGILCRQCLVKVSVRSVWEPFQRFQRAVEDEPDLACPHCGESTLIWHDLSVEHRALTVNRRGLPRRGETVIKTHHLSTTVRCTACGHEVPDEELQPDWVFEDDE